MNHEITSIWVDVPVADDDGDPSTMATFMARPAEPGVYPNVIVGFEMFGGTGYIRSAPSASPPWATTRSLPTSTIA